MGRLGKERQEDVLRNCFVGSFVSHAAYSNLIQLCLGAGLALVTFLLIFMCSPSLKDSFKFCFIGREL